MSSPHEFSPPADAEVTSMEFLRRQNEALRRENARLKAQSASDRETACVALEMAHIALQERTAVKAKMRAADRIVQQVQAQLAAGRSA